ncbi:MAG: methyltransferase domain-containing protein [Anaerolineaceae bacterium]|jgi:23S rRNA (cytosine1962-C5)-methyltransferase|nr:MAG: methyltransferase domain-containing protein [Anaerolineaceae bacterium]
MDEPLLILKKDREKPICQGHPWIYSGAIERVEGNPGLGETVLVLDGWNNILGRAAYSPASKIRARMWSWKENEKIDDSFFRNELRIAISLHQNISSNAYRLVNAESDHLPGLVVDRYAHTLVLQSLTAGVEYWKSTIVSCLTELTEIPTVYERSDVEVRALEGLPEQCGLLAGKEPEGVIEIEENGLRFQVDIRGGQKTGFYLDQRENRAKILPYVQDKNVLNCFCYSGAFSVYAMQGGASQVVSVDSSVEAIELAKINAAINFPEFRNLEWVEADVFTYLRLLRDQKHTFDVIILDPPKFAPTRKLAEQAARGYKDINLLAMKLLNPGGILVTFSCSGGISAEFFQAILSGAASDAKRQVIIQERLFQSRDHTVSLHFPEGEYLKGFICKVL